MKDTTTRYVRLCDAADAGMRSGDPLLYRYPPGSRTGWVIARMGRSDYYHAGRAYMGTTGWRAIDTCARTGGRNVLLDGEVQVHPRLIDVYEPNPNNMAEALGCRYDPDKAVEWLQANVVGRRYGWWAIFRTALRHAFLVRLFVAPPTGENGASTAYCSHAQAAADRAAGFDPVPNLPDRLTEPGDLARSLFYRYRFTLEP